LHGGSEEYSKEDSMARSAVVKNSPQVLRSGRPLEVFVSYASDLEPESRLLGDVVGRVSALYGKQYGITLHAVLFKRDIMPSSGKGDPQSDINRSLQQATFFIGLMWGRFGAPTPRAKSGMKEEYDIALACLKAPRRNMSHVAYYFCTRKIDPKRVDGRQLKAVSSFEKRVAKDGLYAEFGTKPELERRVREDLESMVLAWKDHREQLDRRVTKYALAKQVAAKSGTSVEKSDKFISAFQSLVRNEMVHGGKVALVGFGTFGVKERKARTGINPRTLKAITIPKRKAAFFRPGKSLRDSISRK
jgi:DNA-binding protein HU-beta